MTASSKHRSAYTRFIPREELGEATLVQFGAVDGSGFKLLTPQEKPKPAAVQAQDEAQLREQQEAQAQQAQQVLLEYQAQAQQDREEAVQEAQTHALEQGRAEAALEWQQRLDDYMASQGQDAAQRLEAVVQTLQAQLQAMQQHMAQDVLDLACDIARQVVRQELRSNPQAVVPVVREALEMLVADGRPATVRLNPQDHAMVSEALRPEMPEAKVQWIADAAVAPGGCLVDAAGAVVDASLEKRWQRALAPLGLASAWEPAPQPAPEITPEPRADEDDDGI